MKQPFGMVSAIVSMLGLAVLMSTPTAEAATAVSGAVKDVSAQHVAGATVYLIPAADVVEMANSKMEIQYLDFIRSKKYRNGSRILSRGDCHDPHGVSTFAHQMRADAVSPNNTYCQSCHSGQTDIAKHTKTVVGAAHTVDETKITCTSCHQPKQPSLEPDSARGLLQLTRKITG